MSGPRNTKPRDLGGAGIGEAEAVQRAEGSLAGKPRPEEPPDADARRVVENSTADCPGPSVGVSARGLAPEPQQSGGSGSGEAQTSRAGHGGGGRSEAAGGLSADDIARSVVGPRLTPEEEFARAKELASPTMRPAFEPSRAQCPICARRFLRKSEDPDDGWTYACDECCREWSSVEALMYDTAERDTRAWRQIDPFIQMIMREPETEIALRPLLRPILRGAAAVGEADPRVIMWLAELVNDHRARPVPRAHLEDLVIEIAGEVAAERRRVVA